MQMSLSVMWQREEDKNGNKRHGATSQASVEIAQTEPSNRVKVYR